MLRRVPIIDSCQVNEKLLHVQVGAVQALLCDAAVLLFRTGVCSFR